MLHSFQKGNNLISSFCFMFYYSNLFSFFFFFFGGAGGSIMDENGDFGLNNQISVRENLRASKKEFNKTEDDLKSLQSVGQIIGEVLRPLDNERCNDSILFHFVCE